LTLELRRWLRDEIDRRSREELARRDRAERRERRLDREHAAEHGLEVAA
jgi:hypothetical protein